MSVPPLRCPVPFRRVLVCVVSVSLTAAFFVELSTVLMQRALGLLW